MVIWPILLDRIDLVYSSGVQRVVVLRDAGRMEEADAAFVERNKRWNADAKNIAEGEKAIAESIEELRAERQKLTGRRTCDRTFVRSL